MTEPARVALQVGAASVRLALDRADGDPPIVVELPARGPSPMHRFAGLVRTPVPELLLVHPASWPADRVAAAARSWGQVAAVVRPVPAPVAAARLTAGRSAAAVLDVGASAAEATRLDAQGRVVACRTVDVGGDRLDDVVGSLLHARSAERHTADAARGVREALSLLPARTGLSAEEVRRALTAPLEPVVGALAEVLAAGGPVPVLLIGGVARTPLLAELVDAAGIGRVTVAPRPEAAAVLGALALPGVVPTPPVAGPPPASRLPAPVHRRHPLRTALAAVAAVAVTAALVVAGSALVPASTAAVPAGVLSQYGYRFDLPAGWEHTGGLPERRRSLLGPLGSPASSDLIAVELSPLGYDAGAEPERAAAELRAEYEAAAGSAAMTGYDPAAHYAGRSVTTYRQAEGRTAVDWYVLFDGGAQLSVGCRHTAASAAAVDAACAVVVGSVRRG